MTSQAHREALRFVVDFILSIGSSDADEAYAQLVKVHPELRTR